MSEEAPGHFELHHPLPACRLSRVDMQELLGLLTEPDVAEGKLVHAGFHVRLGDNEIAGQSPEDLRNRPELPHESSDVFLTVDFGERDRYVRQVLVVFQPDRAMVSIASDDEPWMQRVAAIVERFARRHQAWFRHSGFLQRAMLVGGMAFVTASAVVGNFGRAEYRWVAVWLLVAGVIGVAASALVPQRLRYSVVALVEPTPPGHSLAEQVWLLGALAAFSFAIVACAVAFLLVVSG